MILNYDQIKTQITNNKLIQPDFEGNIKGASYDLTLGNKCYVNRGSNKKHRSGIIELSQGESVQIPPNSIFFFQTLEKVTLPLWLAGKLSLRLHFVRQGLIMPNQTQADPGYSNYLFGMFYNLSDDLVELRCGEAIVSIEFFKVKSLQQSNSYSGKYGNFVFEQFVSPHITSSLEKMNNSLIESNKNLKQTKNFVNIGLILLTILVTVLAIIAGFKSSDSAWSDRIINLEIQQNELKNLINNEQTTRLLQSKYEEEIRTLRNQIDKQDQEFETLKRRFK